MSVESLVKNFTDALNKNTEALEAHTAALGAAPAASGGKRTGTGTGRRATGAGKGRQAAAKKKPEIVLEKYGAYLNSSGKKADQDRLGKSIHPILDRFGCQKVSEIPDDGHDEAIELVDRLQAAYDEGGLDAVEAIDLFESDGDQGAGGDNLL